MLHGGHKTRNWASTKLKLQKNKNLSLDAKFSNCLLNIIAILVAGACLNCFIFEMRLNFEPTAAPTEVVVEAASLSRPQSYRVLKQRKPTSTVRWGVSSKLMFAGCVYTSIACVTDVYVLLKDVDC